MLISLVIATFNEAENVSSLWKRLRDVGQTMPQHRVEVVFIDDGSVDETVDRIQRLEASESFSWRLIKLSRNFGHQAAISAGMRHATGDVLIFLDADLQDPPELIPEFLSKYEEGYDAVYGVRKNRKEPFWLKVCFAGFYKIYNLLAEQSIPADAGDFGLISKRVATLISNMPERDRLIRCMRSWVGFRQVGIPYDRPARHAGESGYRLWRRIEGALDGLFGYSKVPIRFAAVLGFVVVVTGFLYLFWVYTGWLLFHGRPVQGWISIITLGFIVAGSNILVTAIAGEYACRNYFQAKARPLFVVESILLPDQQANRPPATPNPAA